MFNLTRRELFAQSAAAAVAPALAPITQSAVDFRYSPAAWQTAICLPDDPHKTLVGERGDLRYGHTRGKSNEWFETVVEFSAAGMEPDNVTRQWLEAPGVPIVHTEIERSAARLHLIAFATNLESEGRVDNVILEVLPRGNGRVHAVPVIRVKSKRGIEAAGSAVIYESGAPLLVSNAPLGRLAETAVGWTISVADGPARYLFRLPQDSQTADPNASPGTLLEQARAYWRSWNAFSAPVSWSLGGKHNEFLTACARNIQQAREFRDGKLTFQVGPTVYRGLWVVDGHFILEAARYLGYDAEAQQGLEATWTRQESDGGIFAGGGREHWKDTGIALFTLVRQCELEQDWSQLRQMQPEVLKAVAFLQSLCEKAAADDSANGRYGLLPRGFGDGGLSGLRSEFTNTLWVLAGLKAVAGAAARANVDGLGAASDLYEKLRPAFLRAAAQEMRRHPAGFEYLPMLMKEDPQWSAAGEWERARPQSGQWALSHAIYPGTLFEPSDPIVKGHISLMQWCTKEDVPVETGWLPHEGLWTYNAAFVAHAYLWAGLQDWARRTFTGFLNHASPLFCWREEQPVRGSLTAGYVGDMPHNWASAECVLYLRHMLALEDGEALRLLAGIGAPELRTGACRLENSPTRFGRISLELEPSKTGPTLRFSREAGPDPARVELPASFAGFDRIELRGASFRRSGRTVMVEPSSRNWQARWRS